MNVAGKRWILHRSRSDQFKLWNLADLHFGNKACAIQEIKKDIAIINNDPFSFWVGGGDYADYIGRTDKRFDPDCVAEFIKVKDLGRLGEKLTASVRDLLFPIKHKCLGLVYGNHELSYQRWKEQLGLHSWLCIELGVPDLGYSAMFDLSFIRSASKEPKLIFERKCRETSKHAFRIFIHHGAGFATTPAGKLTRLIRFMNYFDADIYMVGHVHDQEGRRQITIGADQECRKLIERHRVGIISGSYLKTYAPGVTTYGEQRGYEPTVLGASAVKITPHAPQAKDRIKGEI